MPSWSRRWVVLGGTAGGVAAGGSLVRAALGTPTPRQPDPQLARPPTSLTLGVPRGGPYGYYASAARWALGHAVSRAEERAPTRLRLALADFDHARDPDGSLPTQLSLAAAAAAGLTPDVVVLTSWPNWGGVPGEFASAAEAGYCLPLDGVPAVDHTLGAYLPAALEVLRHRRRLIGLPIAASPHLLVYHPALLSRFGVAQPLATRPWGWAELVDAHLTLSRTLPPAPFGSAVDPERQYGFFPGFGTGGLLDFIWQRGGDVVGQVGGIGGAGGATHRSLLGEAAAREAVAFFADLYAVSPSALRRPPQPSGWDTPGGAWATGPQPHTFWGWRQQSLGGPGGDGGIYFDGRRADPPAGTGRVALLYQGLSSFGELEVGPMALAELPHDRRRAAALGVHAALVVPAAAPAPDAAAEAAALLAQEAAALVDFSPLRRTLAQIRERVPGTAASNAQTLANAQGYARVLTLEGVTATRRAHTILDALITAIEAQPDRWEDALAHADSDLAALLREATQAV